MAIVGNSNDSDSEDDQELMGDWSDEEDENLRIEPAQDQDENKVENEESVDI